MSDCSMGGRRFYNVPTHRPIEDRLEITVHFHGEFNPHQIVLNRLDREVDYVEVDGERYERVVRCRDCKHRYEGFCMLTDGMGDFKRWLVDDDDYCSDGEKEDGK